VWTIGLSGQAVEVLSHTFFTVRKTAGLKEGSLQTLRQTYATRLKDVWLDLHYIQNQLSHESLNTTEHYLGSDETRTGRLL
jgi:integrase